MALKDLSVKIGADTSGFSEGIKAVQSGMQQTSATAAAVAKSVTASTNAMKIGMNAAVEAVSQQKQAVTALSTGMTGLTAVSNKGAQAVSQGYTATTQALQAANSTATATNKSLSSQAATLAAEYRKQGMSQSDSFKAAWAKIERTSNSGSTAVKQATDKAKNGFTNLGQSSKKAAEQVTASNTEMKTSCAGIGELIKGTFIATGAAAMFAFGKESMKTAISVESSQKRIASLFGSSTSEIVDFAKNSDEALGMSEAAAYQYAAVYGNLFRNITSGSKQNADTTKAMLNASAVIASKTGRTVEDVMERIRSGLLGNTEAIEDLGIYAQVGMIETTDAFKKIANGRSWEKLDYLEQQQIRTLSILEQSHNQFGDTVSKGSALTVATYGAATEELKASAGKLISSVVLPGIIALTGLIKTISAGAQALQSMSPLAKTLLIVGATSLALIPLIALETKGLAFAKLLLAGAYSILIPKVVTFSTVLKASLGWIGLIAIAAGILYSIFGKSKKQVDDTNTIISDTGGNANDAAKKVSDLTKNVKALSKAEKSLAGFDEINKISSGGIKGNSLLDVDPSEFDKLAADLAKLNGASVKVPVTLDDDDTELKTAWDDMLDDIFHGDWDTFWANFTTGGKILTDWLKATIPGYDKVFEIQYAWGELLSDIFQGNWGNFWDNFTTGSKKVTDWLKATVPGYDKVFEIQCAWANLLDDVFHGNWDGFWTNFTTGAKKVKDWLKGTLPSKDTLENIGKAFTEMLRDIFMGNWDKFWKNWETGSKSIQDWFTETFNGVSTTDTSESGGTHGGGNGGGRASIPAFASGAVVNGPTVALVGEAGKEAVMPLENNTGWINELASRISLIMQGNQPAYAGGDTVIPVYIGNDLIDELVVKASAKNQYRTNGG